MKNTNNQKGTVIIYIIIMVLAVAGLAWVATQMSPDKELITTPAPEETVTEQKDATETKEKTDTSGQKPPQKTDDNLKEEEQRPGTDPVLNPEQTNYPFDYLAACTYEGEKYYLTQTNAYDAPGGIMNANLESAGNCNYGWGQPDPICEQITDCQAIYVIKDNIWGYEPIMTEEAQKILEKLGY